MLRYYPEFEEFARVFRQRFYGAELSILGRRGSLLHQFLCGLFPGFP
jgi:hypothetical protein